MIKRTLILSALVMLACEDKKEVNPLVGTWNMISAEGGMYLQLNKTQSLYMGEVEGDMNVSTYHNGTSDGTYGFDSFDIYESIDGMNISASGDKDDYSIYYSITDYNSPLDQYNGSGLNVYTSLGSLDFVGQNYNYTIGDYSLTINADTLIRQLYVDNTGYVIDSTRHATVSGTLTEVGTEISANEPFLLYDDMEMMDELILTLNDDGTGEITEVGWGERYSTAMEWVSTDSTITWTICEEYDGQIECDEGPEFKYEISGETLILSQYEDMCEEYENFGMSCDEVMHEAFGVEIGTLTGFWMGMKIVFSATASAKKSAYKIRKNKKTRLGEYSLMNGYKPLREFKK
ncbi:MAG: hypothetical protein U9N31_05920 [Candidatus Marinimicrobia bacterium]|nr:hypothetical protein [Candidatus Neomarinimicrobiota bacterium]